MDLRSKSLDKPDETLRLEKLAENLVELGDVTVGRIVFQPGWRWSTHMRPHVGGDWCQAHHVGMVVSGKFRLFFPDGSTLDLGPNDVYDIPPGHDGEVIGNEPCVQVEWAGLRAFTGFSPGSGRVLATLLFTDLVASTETAGRLGDVAWRALLSSHFEAARVEFDRYRGREVKTAGDGLLVAFDGPALALNCALAIRNVAAREGLAVRAGVHIGEVERVGSDLRGIAVHETARIMAQAQGGEVLVSELTRTLALASGFAFESRGPHALKGLAGEWHLFALSSGPLSRA
jgi:class 3 adenylate cyclase